MKRQKHTVPRIIEWAVVLAILGSLAYGLVVYVPGLMTSTSPPAATPAPLSAFPAPQQTALAVRRLYSEGFHIACATAIAAHSASAAFCHPNAPTPAP